MAVLVRRIKSPQDAAYQGALDADTRMRALNAERGIDALRRRIAPGCYEWEERAFEPDHEKLLRGRVPLRFREAYTQAYRERARAVATRIAREWELVDQGERERAAARARQGNGNEKEPTMAESPLQARADELRARLVAFHEHQGADFPQLSNEDLYPELWRVPALPESAPIEDLYAPYPPHDELLYRVRHADERVLRRCREALEHASADHPHGWLLAGMTLGELDVDAGDIDRDLTQLLEAGVADAALPPGLLDQHREFRRFLAGLVESAVEAAARARQ